MEVSFAITADSISPVFDKDFFFVEVFATVHVGDLRCFPYACQQFDMAANSHSGPQAIKSRNAM